jgi:hypothetical protein
MSPSDVFTYPRYSTCKTKLTYAMCVMLLPGHAALACIWLKVDSEVDTSIYNCQVRWTEACYNRRISVDLESSSHVMSINASEYIKLYFSSSLLRIYWPFRNGFIWCFRVTKKMYPVISQQLNFLSIQQLKLCDTTKTFQ